LNTQFSQRNRGLAGAAGVLGALLFFAGNMLFYGHLSPGASFHQGMIATVTNASLPRLFAGGLVGPIAACLCIIGFWHVYLNVRPSAARIRQVMLAAFFVLMVFGSAIHTLWTAKGLAIKYCYGDDDVGCRALLQAANSYWDLAYNIGATPGYAGALLLIALVLQGKTWYPKWTVLANPAALMLLAPLANRAPAPFGAILSGGFTNLTIAIFFLVSLCTTWNRPEERATTDSRRLRHIHNFGHNYPPL
jgi:energy-coupling factor transporter transmembrane protein EcfT